MGVGLSYNGNSQFSNKCSYGSKNYLGKNSITLTHWRRYQRKKKMDLKAEESSKKGKLTKMVENQMDKRPIKERLFPPSLKAIKPSGENPKPNEDDDMLTDNFNFGSEGELDIIYNVVIVLPIEYGIVIEVE